MTLNAPKPESPRMSESAIHDPKQIRWHLLISAGLIAITLYVFLQVVAFDLVGFDDHNYVTQNPFIHNGLTWESIKWAFLTNFSSNWMPLTWLSFMLDSDLYAWPIFGFHFTNLILHICNTLLLFYALRHMTGSLAGSAMVAGLFAIHPLHVESVVWVMERKGLLSTLFGLLSLQAYIRYVGSGQRRWFGFSLGSYAASLMSKQMLVTLPFLLLLLDFWPLGRCAGNEIRTGKGPRSLLLEKIPFFALAGMFAGIAYWAQWSGGSMRSWVEFPPTVRVENALIACVKYLGKTIWPTELAVLYPHSGAAVSHFAAAVSALLLIGITVIGIHQRRKRPYLLVGWLWFLVSLLPVLGIVQIGVQEMADRYTYVPLIGLFVIVVWSLAEIALPQRWQRRARVGVAALLLSLYAGVAAEQTSHWKNQKSLFTHAVSVTENNYVAHTLLGSALLADGELDEAEQHLEEALRISPDNDVARTKRGDVERERGDLKEALWHYSKAIRINPNSWSAHFAAGAALHQLGRLEDAHKQYRKAITLCENCVWVRTELGVLLLEQVLVGEAVEMLQETVEIAPTFARGHELLGDAMVAAGDFAGAVAEYQRAVQYDPVSPAGNKLLDLEAGSNSGGSGS